VDAGKCYYKIENKTTGRRRLLGRGDHFKLKVGINIGKRKSQGQRY